MENNIVQSEKMSVLKAISPLLVMICTTFILAFLLYPSFFSSYKSEVETGYILIGPNFMASIVSIPFSLIIGIYGFMIGSKYRRIYGGDGYGLILKVISFLYIIFNYKFIMFLGAILYPFLKLNCPNCPV